MFGDQLYQYKDFELIAEAANLLNNGRCELIRDCTREVDRVMRSLCFRMGESEIKLSPLYSSKSLGRTVIDLIKKQDVTEECFNAKSS